MDPEPDFISIHPPLEQAERIHALSIPSASSICQPDPTKPLLLDRLRVDRLEFHHTLVLSTLRRRWRHASIKQIIDRRVGRRA
jgi:hypothetical protein